MNTTDQTQQKFLAIAKFIKTRNISLETIHNTLLISYDELTSVFTAFPTFFYLTNTQDPTNPKLYNVMLTMDGIDFFMEKSAI